MRGDSVDYKRRVWHCREVLGGKLLEGEVCVSVVFIDGGK